MPDLSRASFSGAPFPNDVADFIASAIIGGSPFASTLTRRPSRGNLAIPAVNAVTGQGWVAEGADLPDISLDTGSEIVVTKKLGGIVGLTNESIEDTDPRLNLAEEVTRVVRDAFSGDLDSGLLNGDGTLNTPTGVLARAAQVSGPTLTEAIGVALAEMGEAGGTPTHVAMSPTDAVAEATRTDGQGRPLYAGGVLPDLYGLTLVRVPGLEQPLVYDATSTYLVVAREFTVRASGDYAPAFKADKTALRVTGRFGVGIPTLAKSVRKVQVIA
jgi:HK97 family phage major capsid protein